MDEYEDEYNFKFRVVWEENMGRALGVGFCYVGKGYKQAEIYLYINLWKWNLAIGRIGQWS